MKFRTRPPNCLAVSIALLPLRYPTTFATAYLGGMLILAELTRAAVKEAGMGTGYNGFRIELPASVWLSPGASIATRIRGIDEVLRGSPKVIDDELRYAAVIDGMHVAAGTVLQWAEDLTQVPASLERYEALRNGIRQPLRDARCANEHLQHVMPQLLQRSSVPNIYAI